MEARTIKSGEGHSEVEVQLRGSEEINGNDLGQTEVSDGGGGGSGCGAGGARYKLMSPAKLPISRSPCISIPPGLSPSSFLESPVLLSNVKVEPSPTTGSFTRSQLMHGSFTSCTFPMNIASSAITVNERKSSFFDFKPHNDSDKVSADVNDMINEHSVQLEGQSLAQSFAPSITVKSETVSSSNVLNLSASIQMNESGSTTPELDSDELNPEGKSMADLQLSGTDAKEIGIPVAGERVSDDGYNWRKYGQKHVKGCEFPRSYYKCTHPNCDVKKLFERSHDGQITEIIYKGTHDHPKPQPSRRYTVGTTMSVPDERPDKAPSLACIDDETANGYGQISQTSDPNATPDRSPMVKNDDGPYGLDAGTNKVHNDDDDDDDEDPFSKRRRMDIGSVEITPVVKPIREPRVVVQTLSEVDILDDGYRWRKYGQKVVRGNPNPSYYKCTNAGCPVRKHVERASHDPKAVITTYEGKHNHDVPTAKSSSHDMAGPATGSGPARITSAENNATSLNLGVGINSAAAENRMNGQGQGQLLPSEYGQNQTQPSASNMKLVRTSHPVSAYFGVVNTNTYGYRGSLSEGHSMDGSSLSHSTYPYPQEYGKSTDRTIELTLFIS